MADAPAETDKEKKAREKAEKDAAAAEAKAAKAAGAAEAKAKAAEEKKAAAEAKKAAAEEAKAAKIQAKADADAAWRAGKKEWEVTLFGCCKGPDAGNAICVFAYFPCCSCLNGNAAVVSGLGGYQLCCLGTCFAPCCTHAMMRMKVVEKYKLLEPSYKTIPIACCCCPCSTVQLTSQIMQEHEKQFSDIIASAALVDRPAGLEGAKKLRPSMLGDLEREVSRWNKIDQLEAPLANVMDREQRVDVAESLSFSLVAKMAAEIVYEGWMEHELDKHSSYMQQVMLSDLLDEMVENVSEEVCAGWSQHTDTAHAFSKQSSLFPISLTPSLFLPSLSLLLCVHTGVARPLYHEEQRRDRCVDGGGGFNARDGGGRRGMPLGGRRGSSRCGKGGHR